MPSIFSIERVVNIIIDIDMYVAVAYGRNICEDWTSDTKKWAPLLGTSWLEENSRCRSGARTG
jgi:hypothetical protein